MFSQYFGNYLLNKNIITKEQLKEILELQKSIHIKLGVLALNYGYMNSEQVEEVHQLQKKMDKRFGEIAIELGYLNEEQLLTLLSSQNQGYLQISQALIDKNYLTLAQLEKALDSYKKDCQITSEELEDLKQGNITKIVHSFLDFNDSKYSDFYYNYTILMLKDIIRLLDDSPYLKKEALPQKIEAEWLICQEIMGKYNLFTGIAGDQQTILSLACKFAGEIFSTIDELAKSAITEFLNVHNGIFIVNLSNQNIELELKPQEVYRFETIESNERTFIIPIYLSEGNVKLILSDKNFMTRDSR